MINGQSRLALLYRELTLLRVLVLAGMASWGVTAVAGDLPPAAHKELRCPVCGMIPANYPKWRTQVTFRDGAVSAFDSPAEMFRFLGNMAKYDNKHTSADIAEIQATGFIKKSRIDARRAFYVSGSSARGPMGPDLPAFGNKADAEFFARNTGGKVLDFSQASKEISSATTR
jgi:nitrous oxide reductase accessory protein NosL